MSRTKLHFLILTGMFVSGEVLAQEAQTVGSFPPPEGRTVTSVSEGKRFWVSLGGTTASHLGKMVGGVLGAGYQWALMGLDVKATKANAQFSAIFTDSNYQDKFDYAKEGYDSVLDPGSELNRPRSPSDRWGLLLVEPGISVAGKAFPDALPKLSQKARFGLGYGSFTDNQNSLSFSAFLFSVQGSLQYQIQRNSRWAFELSGALKWGRLLASGATVSQLRRLPVIFVGLEAGLVYWF